MLPLDTICKQSISAKFLWSFGCCEGLARCWVKPDYKYSQERGLRVCWVPFVPILCPSSVSHCCRGGCSWGGAINTGNCGCAREVLCQRGSLSSARETQPGLCRQLGQTERSNLPKTGGSSKGRLWLPLLSSSAHSTRLGSQRLPHLTHLPGDVSARDSKEGAASTQTWWKQLDLFCQFLVVDFGMACKSYCVKEELSWA